MRLENLPSLLNIPKSSEEDHGMCQSFLTCSLATMTHCCMGAFTFLEPQGGRTGLRMTSPSISSPSMPHKHCCVWLHDGQEVGKHQLLKLLVQLYCIMSGSRQASQMGVVCVSLHQTGWCFSSSRLEWDPSDSENQHCSTRNISRVQEAVHPGTLG